MRSLTLGLIGIWLTTLISNLSFAEKAGLIQNANYETSFTLQKIGNKDKKQINTFVNRLFAKMKAGDWESVKKVIYRGDIKPGHVDILKEKMTLGLLKCLSLDAVNLKQENRFHWWVDRFGKVEYRFSHNGKTVRVSCKGASLFFSNHTKGQIEHFRKTGARPENPMFIELVMIDWRGGYKIIALDNWSESG